MTQTVLERVDTGSDISHLLPQQLPAFHIASAAEGIVSEDEWIWGAVAAAIVLFGGVAAACRAICWGSRVKKCKTTWYGMLDVECY